MTIQVVRLVVQEAGVLPRHRFALVETSRLFDNNNFDPQSRFCLSLRYSELHYIEGIIRDQRR